MIKVFIVDDHELVREGLKMILKEESDIIVVAEAENGPEALEKMPEIECDVMLLDMNMPGLHGIELIEELIKRYPQLRILVLSIHPEDKFALRTIKVGASGYLCKDTAMEELVKAIIKVNKGEKYLSNKLAEYRVFDTSFETDTESIKNKKSKEKLAEEDVVIEKNPEPEIIPVKEKLPKEKIAEVEIPEIKEVPEVSSKKEVQKNENLIETKISEIAIEKEDELKEENQQNEKYKIEDHKSIDIEPEIRINKEDVNTNLNLEQVVEEIIPKKELLPHELMSKSEFDIMFMIASGKNNIDIATELELDIRVVNTYRIRIFKKLDVKSTTELTQYAINNKLIKS